jgi:hypothetical protein
MLSSVAGQESEDGCRIKSGMTVFFSHPGLDPGSMLSSVAGQESEDGCRIKSGMTVFFVIPGLTWDPFLIQPNRAR